MPIATWTLWTQNEFVRLNFNCIAYETELVKIIIKG